MSLIGLASKCGVTSSSLQDLINGNVRVGISTKLGLTTSSLQTFLNGGTSIGLASKIGITSSSLQLLRNQIGQEGAVGLIIGLLIKEN
ncbi:hypothetical protein [Sphingobacterium sp. UBA5996]|uniref:hypothetical protein n=1 Tax=Sphingobacterium sp. UBA5996 TaxID=1947505 RepID=UPI0025EF4FB4|nr:hypothetical protein [Sphingobacterium sp. UBA5996]